VPFHRGLVALLFLPLINSLRGQQALPPVYFNHFSLYINQATIEDLEASSFLKQEFSTLERVTTKE
jgi:hypothetical protein